MASLSFIPESLDLALYAGDGCAVKIVIRDNTSSHNPIDVTGTHEAQIRVNRLDATVVEQFNFDLSDATDGVVILSLTGDQTSNLGDGFKGSWDWQWTAAGSEPLTLVQGKITCVIDVSRP
jgi:hypothetical protein